MRRRRRPRCRASSGPCGRRRAGDRRAHRILAARRHPVPQPASARAVLRPDGDAAGRSAARLQRGAQVHQHADDAGRPGRRHGLSGRRRPRQAGLHRQQGAAARGGADAHLRRRQGRRRHSRHARGGHRLRPGRCRVRDPEHRSPAVGAADGGRDAAAAARPEVARLLLERPAAERRGQPGAAAGDHERGASGERLDLPRGRARPRGQRAARRRDAAVAGRRRRVDRTGRGNAVVQLPAIAGHALFAREGHGRQGDVRLQRSVDGHRAGGPGGHELLHRRLLQQSHGARRQVPPREGLARRRLVGRA